MREKQRGEHRVPVTDPVSTLLESHTRPPPYGVEWILPSTYTVCPIQSRIYKCAYIDQDNYMTDIKIMLVLTWILQAITFALLLAHIWTDIQIPYIDTPIQSTPYIESYIVVPYIQSYRYIQVIYIYTYIESYKYIIQQYI